MPRPQLSRIWYQHALPWLVTRLFIGEMRLLGGQSIPASGPVLFVGLHKAGMMDGYAYARALPRPVTFMVAARLLRKPWLRPLVDGIGVARRKDGDDTGQNQAALAECAAVLRAGRALVIFPEGTSTLGPRHLPFAPGAARLALACPEAAIVPLAIHYQAPTRAGTAVEIVAGKPFHLPADSTMDAAQARVTAALEAVAADCADWQTPRCAEFVAFTEYNPDDCHIIQMTPAIGTRQPVIARSPCDEAIHPHVPAITRMDCFVARAPRNDGFFLTSQGTAFDITTLQPGRSRLLRGIMTAIHAPAALAADSAARRLADDDTVVLTLKMLGSLLVLPVWITLLLGLLLWTHLYWGIVVYAVLATIFLFYPRHA